MIPELAFESVRDLGTLKVIGLFFFLAMWIAIAVWLLFSRRDRFRTAANLPLHDDHVSEPRRPSA